LDADALASAIVEAAKVLQSGSNPWVPVWSAILGALAGGAVSLFPQLLLERIRAKKKSGAVQSAIYAEISGLIDTIGERGYVEALRVALDDYDDLKGNGTMYLAIDTPPHYNRIYSTLSEELGHLDKEKVREIVLFYQKIDSIVQDLSPDSVFADGLPKEVLEADLRLLQSAVSLGQRILGRSDLGVNTPR